MPDTPNLTNLDFGSLLDELDAGTGGGNALDALNGQHQNPGGSPNPTLTGGKSQSPNGGYWGGLEWDAGDHVSIGGGGGGNYGKEGLGVGAEGYVKIRF
jgi:hypothetical protein